MAGKAVQKVAPAEQHAGAGKLIAGNMDGILLAAIFALALLTMAYNIGADSFWQDETFSVIVSGSGGIGSVIAAANGDVHPPLYFVILHFFLMLPGRPEVIARLPSLAFGVLSVPVIYLAGREMFNRGTGLASAFLYSISFTAITYSQEARMYPQVIFFGALATYSLFKAVKDDRPLAWGLFAFSAIAIYYSHYYGALLVGALILYALAMIIYRRQAFSRRSLHLAAGCVVIALAILPQAVVMFHQTQGTNVNSDLHSDGVSFFPRLGYFLSAGGIKNPITWQSLGLTVLFGAAALLGLVAGIKKYSEGGREAIVMLSIVFAFTAIVGLLLTYRIRFCGYRYFIFLLGPYLTLVAYGITSAPGLLLPTWTLKPSFKKLSRGACLVIAILALISVVEFTSISPLYAGSNVDLGDSLQYVKDHMAPGDRFAVLCDDSLTTRYYVDRMGMGSALVGPGSIDSPDALAGSGARWAVLADGKGFSRYDEFKPALDARMERYTGMTRVAVYGPAG